MISTRRAFALLDLLVAFAAIATLLALTAAALGGNGPRTRAARVKDAIQLKQIHQSFLVYSKEFKGILPRPGLIDRLPIELNGESRNVPGRGQEDVLQNTTAKLYSSLIIQNYFAADLLVSPVERNPRVTVAKAFDYERYDPGNDVYWDASFTADLETGSSVSYAHLVIFGARAKREWRDTMNASFPVLANRGPRDGEADFTSFTCGPHGHWAGNVVFNDNRTVMLATMTLDRLPLEHPADLEAQGVAPVADNIFAMETGAEGSDAVISFTKRIAQDGPVLQHD